MRNAIWVAALLGAVIVSSQGRAGEPPCGCEAPGDGFAQRIHPVGGWHPYGGGLLRWWDPCCYPRYCGPDDYCRKPLPRLCWPGPYPSSYTWGPPETCCHPSKPPADCNKCR